MKRWALLSVLGLAACASHPVTGPLPDEAYQTAMSTGKSAFDLGHPEEATRQYQQAFRRALLRDDAAALHDAGFNLATAQLEQQKAGPALQTLDQVRAALSLRQQGEAKDLAMLRSAVLLRLGRTAEALSAARVAQTSDISADRVRAGYLAGRAAFVLKNQGIVAQEAAALCAVKSPDQNNVDCLDLRVRQGLLQGQGGAILPQALVLAGQRRDAHDYAGMRDALSLAAEAAMQAGDRAKSNALKQRVLASRSASEGD